MALVAKLTLSQAGMAAQVEALTAVSMPLSFFVQLRLVARAMLGLLLSILLVLI